MENIIIHPGLVKEFYLADSKKSIFVRWNHWLRLQEKNHVAWVGITITAMAAVFFPVTMAAILFNGAHFGLIIAAMVSLSLVVIANLTALPPKYTIPSFIIGITMDLILIVVSFTHSS